MTNLRKEALLDWLDKNIDNILLKDQEEKTMLEDAITELAEIVGENNG